MRDTAFGTHTCKLAHLHIEGLFRVIGAHMHAYVPTMANSMQNIQEICCRT